MTVGNSGANGTPHLAVVALAERERIEVVHVPYRASNEAAVAVASGEVTSVA